MVYRELPATFVHLSSLSSYEMNFINFQIGSYLAFYRYQKNKITVVLLKIITNAGVIHSKMVKQKHG